MLLFSAAARRLAKLMLVLRPELKRFGALAHQLERYQRPELSFSQIVSSPDRHALLLLDNAQVFTTAQFVRDCKGEHGDFRQAEAASRLKELWRLESGLLATEPDYRKTLRDRDLGEVHPTEAADVVYDNLGHWALCILEGYPEWKAWTLAEHRADVETLASYGSWQARQWLGLAVDADLPRPADAEVAARFFLGDQAIAERLGQGYGYR